MRTLIWFSCGAASFTASFLTLKQSPNALLVYCDTGGEHPDNKRFLKDSEQYFKKEVTILKSQNYADHFDVCEKTKYINGVNGARCTVELKKKLRYAFQKPDDLHIFGYTVDEKDRAQLLQKAFPELDCEFPLIENNFTKERCLGLVKEVGIEIPVMYRLGFNNTNCIGCVKGGMGYWNKIRKHFPEQFNRMAKVERAVGHSCIKNVFLDELDPNRGREVKEIEMTCDFVCQSVIHD